MDANAVAPYELVPTPREFVADVYGLLAKLMTKDGSAPEVPEVEEPAAAPVPALTDDLVKRMYSESEPSHRKLFKYLATRPDEWIFADKLASDLALSGGRKSLAGTLGALGRRCNHRYKGLRPFESTWDHAKHQTKHRMSVHVADIIKTL
jgi:hypothetical protein